jgi:hypothetical protein
MPTVRRTVLAVLSAWHGLAALKNLCDLAAAFGIVPAARRFGSGNFAAIEKLLAPLHAPRELLGTLLLGAAALEGAAAAGFALDRGEPAFALSLALFGSFAVIDELMADYQLDETHREILSFVLIAYLVAGRPDANERSS